MKNYKFIFQKEDFEVIIGEVKNNRLIYYEDLSNKFLGNIYRGRIKKYINSLDAFIVDIGLEKDGILRIKNVIENLRIERDVIVEVIKESQDDKMYELSQKITISNPYMILFPYLTKNSDNKFKYHYKLRTRGKNLKFEDITYNYKNLEKNFLEIEKEKYYLPTPKLLLKNKKLNDFVCDYHDLIISNKELEIFSLNKVLIKKDFNPIYDKVIFNDLRKLKDNKILVDGANIVIECLEALTVIDVNSGYKYFDLEKNQLSLRINLSILEELVIQLLLRNIKKMVIIDFIRMNKNDNKILIDKLKFIFDQYDIKYKILGFTKLGFLEILVF